MLELLLEEGTISKRVVMNGMHWSDEQFCEESVFVMLTFPNKALLIFFLNEYTFTYISCPLKFNVLFCDLFFQCLLIVEICFFTQEIQNKFNLILMYMEHWCGFAEFNCIEYCLK